MPCLRALCSSVRKTETSCFEIAVFRLKTDLSLCVVLEVLEAIAGSAAIFSTCGGAPWADCAGLRVPALKSLIAVATSLSKRRACCDSRFKNAKRALGRRLILFLCEGGSMCLTCTQAAICYWNRPKNLRFRWLEECPRSNF